MSTLVRDAVYAKGGAAELDTTVKPYIRIINGALDSEKDSPAGIILQGRLDPATLRFLKADDYQRPIRYSEDIMRALREGKVLPNVEIGVRGQEYDSEGKNGLLIRSPCYIIDGQQRVGNTLTFLETNPQAAVRLNATIHFKTDYSWERKRFDDLNLNRIKVSPNHLMRNMRDENRAFLTLYGLCNSDKSSPLYDRVCWEQNMKRTDLMTAMTVAVVAAELHGHQVPTRLRTTRGLADQLLLVSDKVGLHQFRRNLVTFFGLLDAMWPLADITNRHGAPQIKTSFMVELAHLFSRHAVFWEKDDKELVVGYEDRRKLAKFPINDPSVRQLAGAGGASRALLYQMLIQHMNTGRRQNRLVERKDAAKRAREADE